MPRSYVYHVYDVNALVFYVLLQANALAICGGIVSRLWLRESLRRPETLSASRTGYLAVIKTSIWISACDTLLL